MASEYEGSETVPHTGSMNDETTEDVIENTVDEGANEQQGVENDGEQEGLGAEDQPAGDGGEYAFAATNYPLKFRGKTIQPESKEQLINWAQLGYNYKQREEGLKKQESKLQETQQQIESMQRLSDYFDQNPEFAKQVQQLFHKYQSGQLSNGLSEQDGQEQGSAGENGGLPPAAVQEIQALKQEISELKGFRSTFEQQNARQSVEKEIADLKGRYSDEQWELEDAESGKTLLKEVLELSAEKDVPLEMAYRHLKWDSVQNNADAEARKREEQRRIEERKQGIVDSGGKPAAKEQPNLRGQGYRGVASFLEKEDVDFFR